MMYPEISEELIKMREDDQAMRKSTEWDSLVDHRNTQRLKEIVEKIGWPTISKVGEDASMAAWLIAQHADKEICFQQHALVLMKNESAHDVKTDFVAYLEDRVRVNTGKPQLYGTQFYTNEDGVFGPQPIEDIENLDERRKDAGLGLFADYFAHMQEVHAQWLNDRKR